MHFFAVTVCSTAFEGSGKKNSFSIYHFYFATNCTLYPIVCNKIGSKSFLKDLP